MTGIANVPTAPGWEKAARGEVSSESDLLPDPPRAEVWATVISVDDHLVEPAHMFEGRLPAKFADRAPEVRESSRGDQYWSFDDQRFPQVGLNAMAGLPKSKLIEPVRFDGMRRGCWDIHARIHDMDLNGVWASVNFPSALSGFCGTVYSDCRDPDLGFAVMQAYNDWVFDEWYGSYPERIVPLGITWLKDPERGAEEIRRNAARGFTAVTLPERPHKIGYPSLNSGYWDPIVAACDETDTVVCLHVGSSGMMDMPPDGPLIEYAATLFSMLSMWACADWLWSFYPVKHPNLKIAMSEGGIGWVPMLGDRLDFIYQTSEHGRRQWDKHGEPGMKPSDMLRRNFWYCTIDDPSMWPVRDVIGTDRIMLEVDYPHADSTWPDTQRFIEEHLGPHLSTDEVAKVTHRNAAALFRHPLPADARP